MADSEELPVPEESPQAAQDTDRLDAELQRLADLVQDLNRRAESRRSQNEQEKREQEDTRRKELGYDPQWEEYERRMRESDARFEENMRDIRRRLDALERERARKAVPGGHPRKPDRWLIRTAS